MDYMAELHTMQIALSRLVESAQIRGKGRASFVFAQHQGRAIEVSENDGKWWMEFWEADDNEVAPAVAEATIDTTDEAIAHAIHWLMRR